MTNTGKKTILKCRYWIVKMSRLFNDEMLTFVKENAKNIGNKDLTEKFNSHFGSNFTVEQIKRFKQRNKITSELTGYFEKGHIPFNKGLKGWNPEKCKETQFKKGHIPSNAKPIGSERIDKDGYTVVKVANKNRWQLKHRMIYEQHYGKIAPSTVVIFLDGDRQNFDISNLKAISRGELAIMCKNGMFDKNPEITNTQHNLATLMVSTNQAKRRVKNDRENNK